MFKRIIFFMMLMMMPAISRAQMPAQAPQEKSVDAMHEETGLTEKSGSHSDLAIDELSGAKPSGPRNPFEPGEVEDAFDLSSLVIQGIVIGPKARVAILSGRFAVEGSRFGSYNIKEIKPGKVVLSQLDDLFPLRMENYSPPLYPRNPDKIFAEFYNADIRQALTVLAKANDLNMIIPEATVGKVTASFINSDVQDIITSILHVNNLEYAVESNIMRIGPVEQFKDGSDLKALSFPLKYATAKELESQVKAFLSDRGAVTSDERTNVIIVKDRSTVISNVEDFLASIDKKDPQVSIEAKIVDASSNFARSLGIQWGFTSGPNHVTARGNQDAGSITNSPNTGTVANLPASNPTSGLDMLIGRLPGNSTLEAQLSAAESNGSIRIISKPNVTTINNKPAKIRSGLKIYVKGNSDISIGGGGTSTSSSSKLEQIDTGVQLDVTPQITLNRMIKMTIKAEESEADYSRTVDGIPAIIDNSATTTVLIPDGETAVIGGLLKVKTSKDKRQVPGVGNVPVLGWLFKSSTKTKSNNELMIFITPKILDSGDFKSTSADVSEMGYSGE